MANVGTEHTFTPGRVTYMQTDTCGPLGSLGLALVPPGTRTLMLDRDATTWVWGDIRIPVPLAKVLGDLERRRGPDRFRRLRTSSV